MPFSDRVDAGRRLAAQLKHLRGGGVVVLGLPRGGVPVAAAVAEALGAPLDVIVVRKLGVPFQPELGMGAIGEGGVCVLNDDVIRQARIGRRELAEVEARERSELERRAGLFRGDRRRVPLGGHTAVIVDDGIATGSTARAACQVARAHGARRIVLAVPVAPPSVLAELSRVADEVVCVEAPAQLRAVGQWYRDFTQTSDAEVMAILHRAAPPPGGSRSPARDEEVEVDFGGIRVGGRLTVPDGAAGLVVFAHGSGSSRRSPRNRFVAETLNRAGIGTLLFDLLTAAEEQERANVFDVELLAGRLVGATAWLRAQPGMGCFPIGYFGASTGAAAALWAAAEPGAEIDAVVSRGGRPELASPRLGDVRAPTLLIVGGLDSVVLDLNRQALAVLRTESRLTVVPGATHLFEEPGTLAAAAALARDWFGAHLAAVRPR